MRSLVAATAAVAAITIALVVLIPHQDAPPADLDAMAQAAAAP